MHAVRKATAGDVSALSTALARAFDDDPVMQWLFPASGRRLRWARRFFALRIRQLLPQEEVYAAADGGAALWALPERWHFSVLEVARLLATIGPGLGWRTGRALKGLSMVENRHPREPHYYLAVLGVDPALQGQGVGSALMEPVLRGCDADGIPAYLESSKERNVDFYGRHGFRVTDELRLPKGPPVWLMWRDPR